MLTVNVSAVALLLANYITVICQASTLETSGKTPIIPLFRWTALDCGYLVSELSANNCLETQLASCQFVSSVG